MATTARIAHLCKADLASEMVVEMTALQGVMGKYYGRHSGRAKRSRKACLIITCPDHQMTLCQPQNLRRLSVWQIDWIRSQAYLPWD
jgi:hypothetical protein